MLQEKCRAVEIALGNKERIVSAEEIAQSKKMRRSLIAVRNLPKGHIVQENDLYAKRPGDGISPDKLKDYVGKIVARDIEADTILKPEDFLEE